MSKLLSVCMLTFFLLIVIAGCGKEKCPTEPPTDPSFQNEIQPILTKSCAIASCHDAFAQGGLDLSEGKAYDNLVDVASVNDPSKKLVVPDDADNSYLVIKIEGDPGDGTSRMPIGGNPLPDSEIELIRTWIDQGAKNN